MYINLDEPPLTNAAEAMDLSGLDDKNVTRAGFEIPDESFLQTADLPGGRGTSCGRSC